MTQQGVKRRLAALTRGIQTVCILCLRQGLHSNNKQPDASNNLQSQQLPPSTAEAKKMLQLRLFTIYHIQLLGIFIIEQRIYIHCHPFYTFNNLIPLFSFFRNMSQEYIHFHLQTKTDLQVEVFSGNFRVHKALQKLLCTSSRKSTALGMSMNRNVQYWRPGAKPKFILNSLIHRLLTSLICNL